MYAAKETTDDMYYEDTRYLLIKIFKVEADWAYSTHLKSMANKKGHKLNPNRLRCHAIKRLKKAAQAASALKPTGLDTVSSYELEAYSLQIRAALMIETFAYADALDFLLRSKFIYESIGDSKDLLE